MSAHRVNLALNSVVFLTVLTATIEIVKSDRNYPGAIELVGFNNNRRARMNPEPSVAPSLRKEKADIETVKQNIEEYNKLLKVDTKKLTDQQKDMLERIVDRVARLKAALDIASSINNETNYTSSSTGITPAMNVKTTVLTTEAALLLLPELAKVTPLSTKTTITIKPTSKLDHTEARASNNLNPGIVNIRADSKSKLRLNTTQKPTSLAKTTTTSNGNWMSSRNPTAASGSIANISTSTANIMFWSTAVTTIQPPQQFKGYLNHKNQNNVNEILEMQSTSQPNDHMLEEKALSETSGSDLSSSNSSIVSDLIYDSNGTASSIYSLANHAREDYYTRGPLSESTKEKKPSATAKPTKYHYYPHNQHIYLLPECAIQQVCNAVYVRLNYTQPLCACPSRYRDPCSASLNEDDQHTTKLIGNSKKKAITLAKTCEATTEMRECRSPKDWSLLALQNTRTGKSHYLVICRCPDHFKLEGPMAHDQPTYASVPGIRVFGMMCVKPGFSIRKPSAQPPQHYPQKKPFYAPTSNKFASNKDTRPSYQEDSYQIQHQANYQYLNRPESSPIISTTNTQDFAESISLNNFGGIYGRNNVRKGESAEATSTEGINSATVERVADKKVKRERRSGIDDNIPPFPWHIVEQFKHKMVWN